MANGCVWPFRRCVDVGAVDASGLGPDSSFRGREIQPRLPLVLDFDGVLHDDPFDPYDCSGPPSPFEPVPAFEAAPRAADPEGQLAREIRLTMAPVTPESSDAMLPTMPKCEAHDRHAFR